MHRYGSAAESALRHSGVSDGEGFHNQVRDRIGL
jgi:hypothetical protein